jgi:hypothetical protein
VTRATTRQAQALQAARCALPVSSVAALQQQTIAPTATTAQAITRRHALQALTWPPRLEQPLPHHAMLAQQVRAAVYLTSKPTAQQVSTAQEARTRLDQTTLLLNTVACASQVPTALTVFPLQQTALKATTALTTLQICRLLARQAIIAPTLVPVTRTTLPTSSCARSVTTVLRVLFLPFSARLVTTRDRKELLPVLIVMLAQQVTHVSVVPTSPTLQIPLTILPAGPRNVLQDTTVRLDPLP